MVKLVYCLRRLPHLSREEFQEYWRENHGPLVRRTAGPVETRRYVQTHTIEDERMEQTRQRLGGPEPFDGVAELWWDNIETYSPENQTPERRAAAQELFEDEQRFIDISQSPRWLAIEHVFVK